MVGGVTGGGSAGAVSSVLQQVSPLVECSQVEFSQPENTQPGLGRISTVYVILLVFRCG